MMSGTRQGIAPHLFWAEYSGFFGHLDLMFRVASQICDANTDIFRVLECERGQAGAGGV
jgi:hypothetical protein